MIRLKKYGIVFLLVITILANVKGQHTRARQALNFNTQWAFCTGNVSGAEAINFNDKSWDGISLPHVMRIEKKHNGGNQVYQGIGWYRRYFKIPASYKNKRIAIEFEGVQTNCDIYLNGKKIGDHHGGYLGFMVDISKDVLFGKDNVLAIKVSNEDDPHTPPGKPQAKLDFNYFGGIYRNVYLVITNQTYISHPLQANVVAGGGVFVSYTSVNISEAIAIIKTDIVNNINSIVAAKLVTALHDKTGALVASTESQLSLNANANKKCIQQLKILNPKLWHPDHPYLYQLKSTVYTNGKVVDEQLTKTGIRSLSFLSATGKADGFYINGEKLYLRGANRHQAYQNIGDGASNSMQVHDAVQLKNGGYNAVRAAHYPQSPAFLDACDSLGLLVIECQPGWQFYSKDSVFVNRSFQDVRQMIRRDRNRPSVFLWEASLNESPTPESWIKDATRIAHEEMPGNQMFTADDYNNRSRNYYDVNYKVTRENGTDPMPERPMLTREWGDTWIADAAKENGLRAGLTYTEKGQLNQCIYRQNALNGETAEDKGGYWDHAKLDANPRMGGYFVWSYNDYTRGYDAVTAYSGVVDINRAEKFGYYQLQAMADAHQPGKAMVHIASYNNRTDLDSNIMVFSNCDAVKLYRNGIFVQQITRTQNAVTAPFVAGRGGSPYFIFHLNTYEAGQLKAEGVMYDKVVALHTISTPLKPDHLEITIAGNGIDAVADGSYMVPFYIKVCDENGTVVTNVRGLESYKINIQVAGAGYLVGGNISAANIAIQRTENGLAYGIVRTKNKAGEIVISAKSDGLASATKKFSTINSNEAFVPDAKHVAWVNEYEKNYTNEAQQESSEAGILVQVKISDDAIKLIANKSSNGLSKIIDENTATGWVSESNQLPLVIEIDMAKIQPLTAARIIWGKDSDWYTYRLEGSTNGTDWGIVKKEEKVSGQEYTIRNLIGSSVRFVRMYITAMQPETSKPAIREIELYSK